MDSISSSFSAMRRSASWRNWLYSEAKRWARCSSALRPYNDKRNASHTHTHQPINNWNDLNWNGMQFKCIRLIFDSYSFSFFVGSSEFVAFIFEATQFEFKFMIAASNFRNGALGFTQVIWVWEIGEIRIDNCIDSLIEKTKLWQMNNENCS